VAKGGRGGVGVVYRCRDPQGGDVAVKLLHPGASLDQRRRFRLEVEALRRAGHPRVVRILGEGELDGAPYLVTEWVDGETLQQRLERTGPLPPRAAAALVASLCWAIEHLHARGLLHRDLNPQNVLLRGGSDDPLIIDFGLAKDLLPSASPTSSVRGRGLGTPAYWPPEQARGDVPAIGPRSDVYGLGGVLFSALTGHPPHRGETLLEQLAAPDRLPELPPRAREHVQRRVDPRLWAVCMRALTPAQEGRQPTAAALAGELEAWLQATPEA
jgi:serine/threonine-protein kinase